MAKCGLSDKLKVTHFKSTFFDDTSVFSEGSIQFDNALLMENIEHEWQSLKSIKCL